VSIEHVIQHSSTRWQQLDEIGSWQLVSSKNKETVDKRDCGVVHEYYFDRVCIL
jgi:hypothetical protein